MQLADTFLLAGVMGWPILHSRSPLMHNHWMAQQGLKGAYVPLAIQAQHLAAALRALPALGFAGCNLTMPHKVLAMEMVDEVHESARQIGAISCVTVRSNCSLLGSNNDALGFMRNLHHQQPSWRPDDGPAVVLGAGGGARAVCHGLMQAGVAEIRVINRSADRAQALAQSCGVAVQVWPWPQRHEALQGAALLVNTTSQGMQGQGALHISLDSLPRSAIVADIVYIPLLTPLLAAAAARGNATVDGLGMLLQQGPLAWKAWWGLEPAVTPELRKLVESSLSGQS